MTAVWQWLAGALFGVVLVRCAIVCNALRLADRGGRSYLAWEAYGLSYCLLVLAAGGSALQIVNGRHGLCDWLWLLASAGLIAFDRRAPPLRSSTTPAAGAAPPPHQSVP